MIYCLYPTFVASFSSTDPILVVLIDTSLVSCNFTFSGLLIPAPTLAAEKETPIRTCLQKNLVLAKGCNENVYANLL